MSTDQTWQIKSTSLEDTLQLAEQIGSKLRGGEVVELISDVGGGKTAFTRGLACGMGSKDQVRSPSFTISNQYTSSQLTMHHFDFYRLKEPGIVQQEIAEVLEDPKGVVVVEWAGIVDGVLPVDRITISITALSETEREITLRTSKENSYLMSLEG